MEASSAETGWIRERIGDAGPRNGALPVSFNLRFAGQQFDEESGLHYNHHRYYDPYLTVGYTQADPIGLDGGWNRFGYVDGDPLGSSDPEGLQTRPGIRPWENMPIGGGGGGAAGGRFSSGAGSTGRSRPVVPVPPIPNPDKEADKDIWRPDKKPEKWICKARADCNDNIPGNCPPDPKNRFSFGGGEANDLGTARNIAKPNATSNLQCRPKHI